MSTSIKFPYIKDRPRLTAWLETPFRIGKYIRFLIDTGADCSVISKLDAISLGIDVKTLSGKEVEISYANSKEGFKGQKIHLRITIGEYILDAPFIIGFDQGEALLGREEIFSTFDVLFQEKDQLVIFTKRT